MTVLIIAEAGVNHEKNLTQANLLVQIAADAGCDIFKTQTFTAGEVVTRTCPPADYQISNVGANDQFSMLERLELPYSWHAGLKKLTEEKRMEFLSTAFGFTSFDFLHKLGLKRIKIPSGEISNLPFVIYQARTGLPIILSTGMADMSEIETALAAIAYGYQTPGQTSFITREEILAAYRQEPHQMELAEKVTILHCTTDYPVKWKEVNMHALNTIRDKFRLPVGYSDHTPGLVASFVAVALGATVIEKHYTVSHAWAGQADHPSPDHQASLEPDELNALVEGIRMVEERINFQDDLTTRMELVREVCQAMEEKHRVKSYVEELNNLLGSQQKEPSTGAKIIAKVAKRSLVAVKDIEPGETFTLENLTFKRPAGGLSPEDFFKLVGQPAQQAYRPDDFILACELIPND